MNHFIKIYKKILTRSKMICRRYRLKLVGVRFGENIQIWGKITIEGNAHYITVGDNCSLNHGVLIEAGSIIEIGDDVTVSAYAQLHTSSIDTARKPYKTHIRRPLRIGNNVWIASGAILAGGVVINDNVVIGANSIVLKDLESGYLYGGCPAKKIRRL